jgi:hypothetical protein
MIPMDGYSLDMPGMSRYFRLPGVDNLEGPASIVPVCRALSALDALLRPLLIDILLHAFRREEQDAVPLPQPFWFAVHAEAERALGLTPSTEGEPPVRRLDALTPDAIESVFLDAIAANPIPPDTVITWQEFRIYATEVALPASLAERDVLSIGPEGYSFGVPVVRRADGAWVRGPHSRGELPPFSLHFTAPFVRARLTTYWSIWTPDGAGGADVDRAIRALDAAGWKASP